MTETQIKEFNDQLQKIGKMTQMYQVNLQKGDLDKSKLFVNLTQGELLKLEMLIYNVQQNS